MLHAQLEDCYLKNLVSFNGDNFENQIDHFYSEIIATLLRSANESVPVRQGSFRKPWWNDSLDYLKSISIETHEQWIEAG